MYIMYITNTNWVRAPTFFNVCPNMFSLYSRKPNALWIVLVFHKKCEH